MSNIYSWATVNFTTFKILNQHLIGILIRLITNTDQIKAVVFPSSSIYYYISNINSSVCLDKKKLLTIVKL
jgi:hypothetical protein